MACNNWHLLVPLPKQNSYCQLRLIKKKKSQPNFKVKGMTFRGTGLEIY